MKSLLLGLTLTIALLGATAEAAPVKVLIVDGQNNHDFRFTTPHIKKLLEETGLFTVDVATTPRRGEKIPFRPAFTNYQVILSNYNGERWGADNEKSLAAFIQGGGGFVVVHAANNAFPDWPEFNEMIGLGGWGGRNEKSGPYLRLRDGQFAPDTRPGNGGSHGKQHAFVMDTRTPEHPVMAGLPAQWMHAKDELYDRLRGPARNVTVLASALSTKESGGTGENEPLIMALPYGSGRVFHTALGHNNGADITSQRCVGFIVTLQRGTEWAATGKVTQKVPADFPTADKVSLRPAANSK